jgi:hypothetical protein
MEGLISLAKLFSFQSFLSCQSFKETHLEHELTTTYVLKYMTLKQVN